MTITELKEYIYENKKIEEVLEKIGCTSIVYHERKNYYSCCNKNGDNKTAINISNNKFLWVKNYTRSDYFKDKSDLITLVLYNKSLDDKNFSFFDTIKYLHEILGLKFSFKHENSKIKEKKKDVLEVFKRIKRGDFKSKQNVLEQTILSEELLQDFIPYAHISFFKEGILGHTVRRFKLAYSLRHKRTIIPLRYWLTGELLGFNMRTSIENYDLFDISKYFISPNYQKQNNLFGLWENKEYILKKKYVVVFESEKSVLKRDSFKDRTTVALSGHIISNEQRKILTGLDVEIIICFDKDISLNEIYNACEKFYGIRKISYMYDTDNILGEKECFADKRDFVYKKAFEQRINYDFKEHKKFLSYLKDR